MNKNKLFFYIIIGIAIVALITICVLFATGIFSGEIVKTSK